MSEGPEWAVTETGEVLVRGVAVRFAVTGRGDQDVLLVHGSNAHRWWWYRVVPTLAAHGLRVISLDLSGHGDSGHRAGYDAATWGEELLAVLAAAGSGRPLVAGHSMGGRLALLTAAARPDRFGGLVLVDSPLRPPPSYLAAVAARHPRAPRERRYATRAEIMARFRLSPAQAHPADEVMRTVGAHSVREVDGEWTWKHDQRGFPALYTPDVPAAAAQLRLPLAFVHGAESVVVDDDEAAFVRARVPGEARVVRVAGAAHHLSLDAPDACAAAIVDQAGTVARRRPSTS